MNDIFEVIHEVFASPFKNSMAYAYPAYCPSVKQVIDNNPTTIVKFVDGTKSVVKCSKSDTYNLETAILYAIVKRTFASRIDSKTGEAECTGLGNSLKRIVNKLTICPERDSKKNIQNDITETDKCFTTESEIPETYHTSSKGSRIAKALEDFSIKNEIDPGRSCTFNCSSNKKSIRKRDSRGRFI